MYLHILLILTELQWIVNPHLLSSLPAKQARQENEEKKENKTHMAKLKIQNKVKKLIADRVSFPSTPRRGQALQIIHLGLVQINLKSCTIFSCI